MNYLLFCGGGSAGHVIPNLALMDELKYSCRLAYMGTGGIEKTLIEQAGYPFFEVDCPKLVRSFTLENLKIPARLARAKRDATEILKREKPDLVFSKGGFASYPPVRAAWELHIPAFTHESDFSPGLATRLIAKKCRIVFTSFPETAKLFGNGRYAGSPMRKELWRGDRQRALHKYGLGAEKPVLLVLGGGSGSKAINDGVRKNLGRILKQFSVLHLCGNGNLLASAPNGYVQREFERDMGSAYAAADFVLCRAGSNTVFETLAMKKPTLFVPLAACSRGDQLQNAVYFRGKGLCHVLSERDTDALPEALVALARDKALKDALSLHDERSGNAVILNSIREFLAASSAHGGANG